MADMSRLRVLVTNDDGIDAPGLTSLVAKLAEFCEVRGALDTLYTADILEWSPCQMCDMGRACEWSRVCEYMTLSACVLSVIRLPLLAGVRCVPR